MEKIKVKLGEGALMPVKSNANDACYDLFAAEDIYIYKGKGASKRTTIPTHLSIELPDPCSKWYWKILSFLGVRKYVYFAFILPRSGMTSKGMIGFEEDPKKAIGIIPYRYDCEVKIGVVDQPYRGELGVIVRNDDEGFYIEKGTKIAQMMIGRSYCFDFEQADDLSSSSRGEKGFGSSGYKF